MKKLFILSGVALMVSSSLTIAAGNNTAKYDFGNFDTNKDGQISVVEANGRLAKHFDKIDTDGNDLISKAEFAEMQKMKKARESKKPTFADFDTNNDGSISSAEFEAMKQMKKGQRHQKVDFAKVDANQDGKITKDEAKGGLLKHFDKIDSDKNGSISTTEFAALEKMHKGKGNHKLDFGTIDVNNDSQITKDEAKGRLLKRFDKIDSDKNGSITAAEFAAIEQMHKSKGHKKGRGNHKLDFAQVDTNSDGVITKDEAKSRLLKHFDKLDSDADGKITSAEFELIKNMKKDNKRPTFQMLDTDGNGKISNAEFDTFTQQHEKMKVQVK